MVTKLPSLTLWAQRATILHTMQTFIGYSPVSTGIFQKVPEIFLSGTFLLFSMSSQKHPVGHHIAQSSDLHTLLSSFHSDRPKSSKNLQKWNLSVLNELTKAPFEPMKDTDLKHLTLKTAFLLALTSSEIHAWVANKVSNLGQ